MSETTAPAPLPAPKPSKGLSFPSKAELKRARSAAKAEDDGTMPGHVHGVDYTQWATAIVDLSHADKRPQRVEQDRARLRGKGYLPLGGTPRVDGFDSCEVWVKSREDYEADRQARRGRIRKAIEQGRMSDVALVQQQITGPYGTHSA